MATVQQTLVFLGGRAGLVLVNAANASGSNFAAAAEWGRNQAFDSDYPLMGHFRARYDLAAASDLLVIHSSGDGYVSASTGTRFASPVRWGIGLVRGTDVPVVGDLNRDGLDDLVIVGRGSGAPVSIALNTGTGFTAPRTITWSFCTAHSAVPMLGDVNGDGLADLICVNHRDGAVTLRMHSYLNPARAMDPTAHVFGPASGRIVSEFIAPVPASFDASPPTVFSRGATPTLGFPSPVPYFASGSELGERKARIVSFSQSFDSARVFKECLRANWYSIALPSVSGIHQSSDGEWPVGTRCDGSFDLPPLPAGDPIASRAIWP
jgi:hypothetical protein